MADTMTTAKRHKRGGIYFDDFVAGEVIEHRPSLSQTESVLKCPGHESFCAADRFLQIFSAS